MLEFHYTILVFLSTSIVYHGLSSHRILYRYLYRIRVSSVRPLKTRHLTRYENPCVCEHIGSTIDRLLFHAQGRTYQILNLPHVPHSILPWSKLVLIYSISSKIMSCQFFLLRTSHIRNGIGCCVVREWNFLISYGLYRSEFIWYYIIFF